MRSLLHFIASEVFPVPPFGGLSSFCSLWIPYLQTSSCSPSTHMDMIPPHLQFWIKTPVRLYPVPAWGLGIQFKDLSPICKMPNNDTFQDMGYTECPDCAHCLWVCCHHNIKRNWGLVMLLNSLVSESIQYLRYLRNIQTKCWQKSHGSLHMKLAKNFSRYKNKRMCNKLPLWNFLEFKIFFLRLFSTYWWWTGRPGLLQFMGSQRVRHDWATDLNWTELIHGRRQTQ